MATPATKIRFRETQIEMAHGAGGRIQEVQASIYHLLRETLEGFGDA
jgi:hypothetical protein